MGIISGALRERPSNLSINEYLRRTVEPTWAGVAVSEKSALGVSAFFACLRAIAEDIGKLPFVVYQQGGTHERNRATRSPFWTMLHDRPNEYMTSQQFREYMTASALLYGNGYALKGLDGSGQVRNLVPLKPERVRAELVGDVLLYTLDGAGEPLTKREIFHLPGLNIDRPDGIGTGVLQYARQTVGNVIGANRHAGTFFGNGAKPSSALEHPGKLSATAQKNLKEQMQDQHGGANSNSILVLEEGMKFSPVSMSNHDSQFLESRTFEVLELARWFRMPPHKVAELARATFSNIEHQAIEYVTDTLMPWAARWEAAVNQQVIVTNSIYAELLFDSLLRGTTLDRYNAYQVAGGGNAPFMTRNEIRKRENLPPIEGLDAMLVPLNMQGGQQDGGTNADNNPA